MNNNLKKQLKKIRVSPLTQQEKNCVWKQVCLGMVVAPQKTSHKMRVASIFKKSMAITLIFGMTMGTASAANEAKPGDFLFPLDRAMENAQLSMVSNNKKDELKVKFALERVEEVKEILGEISTKTKIKKAEEEEPEEHPEEIFGDEKITPVDTPPAIIDVAQIPEEGSGSKEKSEKNDETNPSDDDISGTTIADEPVEFSEDEPQGSPSPEEFGTASSSKQENPESAGTEILEGSDEALLQNGSTTETTEDVPVKKEIVQKIKAAKAEMSDVDKKRIELALGTALDFLGDVREELSEQGNDAAALSIDNLLKDLNNQIGTLPENVTFEVKLSPKKQKVQFEITSEDDKEVVQIVGTPIKKSAENINLIEPSSDEEVIKPKEPKLEIKDGILTINKNEKGSKESSASVPPEKLNGEENGVLLTDQNKDQSATTSATTATSTATTTEDILTEQEIKDKEDDGTTTVKVIIKKLDEDFEFSVTDQDEGLHKIIEEYTDIDKKGGV